MTFGRGVVGLFLVAAVVSPGWAFAQAPADSAGGSACVTCHQGLPEQYSAPVTQYKDDVHAKLGFGCVQCHGGDSTASGSAAMDPAKGFLGRPVGRQVLQVCGRCHSDAAFMRDYNPAERVDQVAEYGTSVHGQRLLGMGDTKVATCASCHPAHQIRPPTDTRSSVYPTNVASTCGKCHADSAYMAEYGIPTNQLDLYHESIHWQTLSGGDLSAPTCNDCHGNHGAAPPGVQWVGNVCGQCHTVMETYFNTSRHAQAFAQMGIPGCVACHGNHAIHATADSMLGMSDGAVCTRCHVAGQAGATAAVTMRQAIDSLVGSFTLADSLLSSAEHAGECEDRALAGEDCRACVSARFRGESRCRGTHGDGHGDCPRAPLPGGPAVPTDRTRVVHRRDRHPHRQPHLQDPTIGAKGMKLGVLA